MTQEELRAAIDGGMGILKEATDKAVASEEEAKFAALLSIGITLLGEFLIDIKRIADAVEGQPEDHLDQ